MQRSIGFHVPSELAGSQTFYRRRGVLQSGECHDAVCRCTRRAVYSLVPEWTCNGRRSQHSAIIKFPQALWRRRSRAASGCRSTRRPVPGEPVAATSQRHGRRNCGAGASYSVQSQAV